MELGINLLHNQWRIQDFLEEGAPTLQGGRQHTILPKFPPNCMKLKEFGPPGGARPKFYYGDPPLIIDYKRVSPRGWMRARLHQAWASMPRQFFNDANDHVCIENNGVASEWGYNPFCNDCIVFNQTCIASVIAALMQCWRWPSMQTSPEQCWALMYFTSEFPAGDHPANCTGSPPARSSTSLQ